MPVILSASGVEGDVRAGRQSLEQAARWYAARDVHGAHDEHVEAWGRTRATHLEKCSSALAKTVISVRSR